MAACLKSKRLCSLTKTCRLQHSAVPGRAPSTNVPSMTQRQQQPQQHHQQQRWQRQQHRNRNTLPIYYDSCDFNGATRGKLEHAMDLSLEDPHQSNLGEARGNAEPFGVKCSPFSTELGSDRQLRIQDEDAVLCADYQHLFSSERTPDSSEDNSAELPDR
mmetsp:Transcript_22133/g.70696  ORF Transcript_22133/g.70696 Transcript_22133/m.70696 type:complete len:160 (+) Transcript_22133:1349-1828(+)